MANKCINQILLSGDRNDLMKLIQSELLNYKKNKIYQLHENILMILFQSDWEPPEEQFKEMSTIFPRVEFELIYIEPLLSKAGISWFKDGQVSQSIFGIKNSLANLRDKVIPEVFNVIEKEHFKNFYN